MQLLRGSFTAVASIWLAVLATCCIATTQMQLNYYNDHYCSNYKGNVQVTWADSMATNGQNCYNYRYGSSVNIAECHAGDGFCLCLMYYDANCQGDYASIQYGQHDNSAQWEWNCAFNSQEFKSFRCYYY